MGYSGMAVEADRGWQAGYDGYETRLRELIAGFAHPDVLELGGGGRPSWSLDEMPANVATYTVNDLDQRELDKIDARYCKACFDVCGDASAFAGRYDVVFSRFLAEHLPDGAAMHRNVAQVLRPGGVAIHLFPTLYASPFVLNVALPQRWSHRLLVSLFPYRMTGKFPAMYSWCRGNTPAMRAMLAAAGYRRVEITEFYGHNYYDKIPVLRTIENWFSGVAARRGWSWYASYALVLAWK